MSLYYDVPQIFYDNFKELVISYINLINPSKDIVSDLLKQEKEMSVRTRVARKNNNYNDFGKLFVEFSSKLPIEGNLSWWFISATSSKYNLSSTNEINVDYDSSKKELNPENKFILDIYKTTLN
jgi:hypothetical protein